MNKNIWCSCSFWYQICPDSPLTRQESAWVRYIVLYRFRHFWRTSFLATSIPTPLPSDWIDAHHLQIITLTYYWILSMRISLPCTLTTVPYYPQYPQPLFLGCSSDKGCLRWSKPRTHLGIRHISAFDRDMPVKPPHPDGDSQTAYIPDGFFFLILLFYLPIAGLEPVWKRYAVSSSRTTLQPTDL